MPRILVTNDDGVHSEGLRALARALEPLGEVTIVAPLGDASAIGHALTLSRPLRLEKLEPSVWAVDGTPTDCVNLAVTRVLDGLPDLVVSGINTGYNLGDDVTYSGTVGGGHGGDAARGAEHCGVRVPAAGVRLPAAGLGGGGVARVVLERPLPARTFLNVNVPPRRAHGFRATVQAQATTVDDGAEGEDPRGRKYYWIEEVVDDWDPDSAGGHRGRAGGLDLGDPAATRT